MTVEKARSQMKYIIKRDWYTILERVLGYDQVSLLTHPGRILNQAELDALQGVATRYLKGEPVEYILNTGFFMGMEFYVDPHVLIPREDTECLVEEVLAHIKSQGTQTLLDMCTGSGCIAISLGKMAGSPQQITAVDISQDALAIAEKNARTHAVDITFIQSDLFAGISHKVDVIVSNPPYIATEVIATLAPNVKDHEPMLALDGGVTGLDFYQRLAKESKDYLTDTGKIFMEIGYDQGELVKNLFLRYNYRNVQVKQDLTGLDRMVIAAV